MRTKRLRTRGDRWCEVEIELRPDERGPVLSICGSEGRIERTSAAKRQAREYWRDFLEENPAELVKMQKDYGVRTTAGAARKITEIDGAFHGIDVHGSTDGPRVKIVESCGQIRETIAAYFPEVAPWLPYHLNDMHAGCEHQRAGGWQTCPGYHKPGESCPPPALPFPTVRIYSHGPANTDQQKRPHRWIAVPTLSAHTENLSGETRPDCPTCGIRSTTASPIMPAREALAKLESWRRDDRCEHDALSVPCPVCGYAYGSQWRFAAIPADVLTAIRTWINPVTALVE